MALIHGAEMRVDDPDALTELLHDQWLSVDEITFDPRRRKVSIPVYGDRESTLRAIARLFHRSAVRGRFEKLGVLEFLCVDDLDVTDREGIGYYDLNEVRFEPETGEIELLTGCPVGIRMRASAFRPRWVPYSGPASSVPEVNSGG